MNETDAGEKGRGPKHLFAEASSRYDLRCVKCGRTALEEKRSGTTACPVTDKAAGFVTW